MNKLVKSTVGPAGICVKNPRPILDPPTNAGGRPFIAALILNPRALIKNSCRYNLLKMMMMLSVGLGIALSACSQGQTEADTTAENHTPAISYSGTIVALGDSLTAGLGVAEENAYPAQLARRLQADGYNYRVVNAGVSGETSSGAWSRIEWVIESLDPDIVILETGANDGLRGLDPGLLRSNLDKLVERMQKHDIEVVLAGMRMLPNLGPAYTRAFAEIYPGVAEKHDTILIPFFLDGVAGSDDFNQPDKIHPTAEGYTRIVETIYPYVREAIERHEAG